MYLKPFRVECLGFLVGVKGIGFGDITPTTKNQEKENTETGIIQRCW